MTMSQPSVDFPLTTTLRRCLKVEPPPNYFGKLLIHLGKQRVDDDPLPYTEIVEALGILCALYFCTAEPEHERHWRRFAVWCARQVEHLIKSPECAAALDVADRFTRGEASRQDLDAASAAAWRTAYDGEDRAGWLAFQYANESAAQAASCFVPRFYHAFPCSVNVVDAAITAVKAAGHHGAMSGDRSVIDGRSHTHIADRRAVVMQERAFRLLVTEGKLP